MAFSLYLPEPISRNSFTTKNLGAQTPNSRSFYGYISISRPGSWNFDYIIDGMQLKSSHLIRNSYKTEFATEEESTLIADVPILTGSEVIEDATEIAMRESNRARITEGDYGRKAKKHKTHSKKSNIMRLLLSGKSSKFSNRSNSVEMAIERFRTNVETQKRKQQYLAMYSSVFGGITTDPAAMVIPMDDHMVHRGHGVFDTAAIMDGYLYELDQHLDRFLRSASMAKIRLPFDREAIRRILIQTVSASKCRKGSLRYWLSTGPGDFQLSPSGCQHPSLYAIVIQDQSPPDYRGIKVVTSSIPIKPPQFAVMKSVNYLPNALSKMEAEESDAYAAIWLDFDGYIAEGPNMNVAFVTKEKELLMPEFDKILSGCTARRVLVLAESLVEEGKLKGVKVRKVTVEEGKKADEMMLIGSGVLVRPVVQWDDQVIGNGADGPVAQALLGLILEDMKSGPPAVRVPVPY